MLVCPVCGQHEIGRIGTDQYYCWNCCVELVVRNDSVKVFQIDTEGALVAYDQAAAMTANLEMQER